MPLEVSFFHSFCYYCLFCCHYKLNFILKTDQYDCISDPCHLAWLVDGNQHRDLLSKIDLISCSNGVIRISNLPEANFKNCPVFVYIKINVSIFCIIIFFPKFKCAYDGLQRKAPCSSAFYICSNGTPYLFVRNHLTIF